jgi:putative ABC transport system permease protein
MSVIQSVRLALQGLTANKLRSGLTMLGIIIGVAAVIALVAVGQGAQASVTERFQSLGSNLLVISPGAAFYGRASQGAASAQSLTNEDMQAIVQLATLVEAIAPEYSIRGAQVVYGSKNTQTSALGVTPEYLTVRNWQVDRGNFISQQDVDSLAKVCALGATVAEDLFGSSNYPNLVGKTVKINRQNYQVVGVMASKGQTGFTNEDDQVFIPLSTAQIKFGGAGNTSLESINVQVTSAEMMDFAQAELRAILRARHGLSPSQTDDFNIRSQVQIMEMAQETTGTFTILLGAIAAISLVVGGIGIMNIMLVSVTERTREIGIRKAVGAKRRDILMQFLVEAVVMSGLGGIVGVLVGWGSAQLLSHLASELLSTLVTSGSVIMALGVSLAIGLFFGIYPANRAARLNPIEALRYE